MVRAGPFEAPPRLACRWCRLFFSRVPLEWLLAGGDSPRAAGTPGGCVSVGTHPPASLSPAIPSVKEAEGDCHVKVHTTAGSGGRGGHRKRGGGTPQGD